jgi:hypothetical protein
MSREHRPRHALRYFDVVLDLAVIVRQETCCDVPQRCEATLLDQRPEHERLIEMGHTHLLRKELFEPLKGR